MSTFAPSNFQSGNQGIVPFLFSQFRGPFVYNELTPEEQAKADADAKAKADAEAKAKEEAEKEPKPGSGEERVKKALEKAAKAEERAKAAEEKAAKFEADEKKRQEDEAKAKGEHEKLAEQYAGERDAEKKAREEYEAKVKRYEELAQAQIAGALESIKDADKKKAVESMLEGLSVDAQLAKLPSLLTLVGSSAAPFGGNLPNGQGPTQASLDQKQARFSELLAKEGTKDGLTPKERNEKHLLMKELSKDWKPEAPSS